MRVLLAFLYFTEFDCPLVAEYVIYFQRGFFFIYMMSEDTVCITEVTSYMPA